MFAKDVFNEYEEKTIGSFTIYKSNKLGSGSFGIVYLGYISDNSKFPDIPKGKAVACKEYNRAYVETHYLK